MKCPECGRMDEESKVVNSRPYKHTIKRRRECFYCKHRWNTYEATESEFERNKRSYLPWSDGELLTIIKLYQDGFTKTEIASETGRTRESVSRKIRRLQESGKYFELMKKVSNQEEYHGSANYGT